MTHIEYFYNKQKLYYTDAMTKKTTRTKAQKKQVTRFEPVKVSLAVACLAAVSILWLAIIGATS